MLTILLIICMLNYLFIKSSSNKSTKSLDYYIKKYKDESFNDDNYKENDLVDIIRKGQYKAMRDIEIEKQSKHFPFDK